MTPKWYSELVLVNSVYSYLHKQQKNSRNLIINWSNNAKKRCHDSINDKKSVNILEFQISISYFQILTSENQLISTFWTWMQRGSCCLVSFSFSFTIRNICSMQIFRERRWIYSSVSMKKRKNTTHAKYSKVQT